MSGLSHLGSGEPAPKYDAPDASILECFVNQHPGKRWVVGLDCAEFTSLCPITGQPDFGRIHIHYAPGELCVESKSLKLYLGAYRDHGTFQEDCVNRIADDLQARIAARYLRVYGDFNVRGGIAIRPLAVRTALDLDREEEGRILDLINQHDLLAGELYGGSGTKGF
jgi:7-cyano-7-deazaguanine reductase